MPTAFDPAAAGDSPLDPNAPAAPDSGIFGLDVREQDAALVLVPVPWDATTSYGHGTHRGPAAILAESHQIDLFDIDTGRPYEHGIVLQQPNPRDEIESHAARQLVCQLRETSDAAARKALCARINEASRAQSARLEERVTHLLEQDKRVGVVGGDHASPLGSIRAHARRYPKMGILHLDAHADLRDTYEGLAESHASIMHNVLVTTGVETLVQIGLRDLCEEEHDKIVDAAGRVHAFFDAHLHNERFAGAPFATQAEKIVAKLPREVYLSFDIDGLDPSLCPHTGTPVPGGLTFAQIVYLMGEIRRSGRDIVGFDLVEVAPGPDGDTWDANVGARLLYKMCGFTLMA